MKKVVKAIAVAAISVGVIGSTAIAGSANWTEIKAILDHKMEVTVDGTAPTDKLTPLVVDGVAYLPIRQLGDALDMEVNWNDSQYRIEINQKDGQTEVEAEETASIDGIVLDVIENEDGTKLVDVLKVAGDSPQALIRLVVAEELEITFSDEAENHELTSIEVGSRIEAEYSLAMTKSMVPQSNAKAIEVKEQYPEVEGKIQSIVETKNGWSVHVVDSEEEFSGVVLHVNNETPVLDGFEVSTLDIEQLIEGDSVKGFYGPIMTMSLPPQSAAQALILLADDATEETPEEVTEKVEAEEAQE